MTIQDQQQRWNPEFDFSLTYYLSGPMSGYENYNYQAFEENAQILRQTGVELRSPHELPKPANWDMMSPDALWVYMMNLCMDQMEVCNGIILMKGWPQSSGARAELKIAMEKSWPVWFYHDYQLTNMNRSL